MSTFKKQSVFEISTLKKFASNDWLKEILESSAPFLKSNDDYITLNFFKDGIKLNDYSHDAVFEILKNGNDLSSIPCSFRITNCQKLSMDVMKMCLKLEGIFKQNFTCNLYYTPEDKKNCFDFHVDHQQTYICQIFGEKEWLFPTDNGECMKHVSSAPFVAKSMTGKPVEKIHLIAGDQIHVPFGLIHKAEIKGTGPSLHLTFGTTDALRETYIQSYLAYCLESSGLDQDIKLPVGQDLEEILSRLQEALLNTNKDDFIKKFQEKSFGENLLLSKYGRTYKVINKTNQD